MSEKHPSHEPTNGEDEGTRRQQAVFLLLTVLVGTLVGLVVVAFIVLTEHSNRWLYPQGASPWRRLAFPVLGSLAMGYLLWRWFPDARGSGVPQAKAALYTRDGRISLATVFGKFFCTSATLACGIPLGREGPSVQVGGGIASLIGRACGLAKERVKALLAVGVAAAVAAAFNTPLAGVLFALEEVMGDLHAPVLGAAALASATAWLVVRALLGNEPLLHVPHYELAHPIEFALYAGLGLVGGLVSAAFTGILIGLRGVFLRMPPRTAWFLPVVGGLLVGVMGIFVPDVLGVGYSYVGQALNGQMALWLMASLVVLKLFAVTVSYSAGNAGGIFGPSLFIGAMLGGTVGSVAHHFLPNVTASPGAYALVGMGTAFAGIVRAPMTSVVMIFELTRDYGIVVPLMISNLVSLLVSARLTRLPIYEALAKQDGLHLPKAETHRAAAEWRVLGVMRPVGDVLQDSEADLWFMRLLGRKDFPHVHGDHPLHVALARMGDAGADVLPVVSRANEGILLGVVTLKDILEAYGVSSGTSGDERL